MKTGKIAKSDFKSTWNGPNGAVQYHTVQFEGDTTVYEIGAKDKNPSFLAVGQSLNYEVPDTSKPTKIKKVKENPFAPGGAKPFDSAGVTVGNALTNAVTLIAHGKVELKDLESTTRRIVEIAFKLKDEFAGK